MGVRGQGPKTEILLFSTLNVFQNTEFRVTSLFDRRLGSVDAPKIWRYSEHRCVRKLGKTDFVDVALFRDPLLVAPPGEHLVPPIRDP